jgi:hypothetical protein
MLVLIKFDNHQRWSLSNVFAQFMTSVGLSGAYKTSLKYLSSEEAGPHQLIFWYTVKNWIQEVRCKFGAQDRNVKMMLGDIKIIY